MLSQRDLFDVAIKLFGSIKIISRALEIEEEQLRRYYLDLEDLPLPLYSEIHLIVEKEIEDHIEGFIQPCFHDFFSLKRVRKHLGMSFSQMAEVLGLSGKESPELVRLMENGNVPVFTPISRLIQYLNQTLQAKSSDHLSEFMICQPLGDDSSSDKVPYTIFYTGYPRFLAKPIDTNMIPLGSHSAPIDDCQSLVVSMMIDSSVDESRINERLHQAVKAFKCSQSSLLQSG
ncbi:MAG: hypothetical protein ACOH5I_07000 [Oligoflexus sp.]